MSMMPSSWRAPDLCGEKIGNEGKLQVQNFYYCKFSTVTNPDTKNRGTVSDAAAKQ